MSISTIRFWQDKAAGVVNPELFDSIAEGVAQELKDGRNQKNKSSQLRQFYDQLLHIQMAIQSKTKSFEDLEAEFRMLKARAAYSLAREHTDKNFQAMIKVCVDQTRNERDLGVFQKFFEAVIAYHKFYEHTGGNERNPNRNRNGGRNRQGNKR